MTFEHCELASEIWAITESGPRMRMSWEFRAANRVCIANFDLREEAIPAASSSFHKAGTLGGVAERFTDFVDRFVEPVVEIDKSVCRPEFFLKFLASYDLTVVLKQHGQDLEGLRLKPNSEAVLAQFAGTKIQFENPETDPFANLTVFLHGEVNLR